jgi:hypothetical protein
MELRCHDWHRDGEVTVADAQQRATFGHDKGRTMVMSSHSRALQKASEPGTSRSALTMK